MNRPKCTLGAASRLLAVLCLATSMTIGLPHDVHSSSRPATSLRLCVGMPSSIPAYQHLARGIFNAVILATDRWRGQFARRGWTLRPPLLLDDGDAHGLGPSSRRARRNAQTCLAQKDTVAFIGPLNSGIAFVTEPVLNKGGMATISPSTTNPDLTNPTFRRIREPDTDALRIPYVTYYRTVAPDTVQGPAAARFLQRQLRRRTYFLVRDGREYGDALASLMDQFARVNLGLQRVGTGLIDSTDPKRTEQGAEAIGDQITALNPDAIYCGCDRETAIPLARYARRHGFLGPFLGGDALLSSDWFSQVGQGAAGNTYSTNPGIAPERTAKWFRQAYAARFHVALQFYDANSYDAAAIALEASYRAASAGKLSAGMLRMRRAVVGYVAGTHFRGATGFTSFDANGDTTNAATSIFVARHGRWQLASTIRLDRT